MQINQYTNEAFSINDEDFYDVDFWTGTAFESRKISGLTLKTILSATAATLYTSDGVISGPRQVDLNGNVITFDGGSGDAVLQVLAANSAAFEFVNGTGQKRWSILKDTDGTGSNFVLQRYDNTGGFVENALTVDASTGAITFNQAYSFPTSDGLADQVLMTNGAGVISWVGLVDRNIYDIDGTLNANRKVITDDKNLTFGLDFGDIATGSGRVRNVMNDSAGQTTKTDLVMGEYRITFQDTNTGQSNLILLDANGTEIQAFDGTNLRTLSVTASGLIVNGTYLLPNVDGSLGQVLTTDGAGVLSWQNVPATVVSWGDIIGTLSDQTDLQTALDGKYDDPTGLPTQYIRGDGTYADFPVPVGAGSAVSLFLNGGTSQGTILGGTYYQLSKTPDLGTNADFSLNSDGLIAQFITDVAEPNRTIIPGGNWNLQFYMSASSGGGSPEFYAEIYKYDGSTLTLLGSSAAFPEQITGGTSIDLYYTSVAIAETALNVTDRIAIKVYVIHDGRTITLHTQSDHLSEAITTFSTGIATLNGLTDQVQYFTVGTSGTNFNISSTGDTHTFNIPVSSASNTGLLSPANWSTFNGKQDAITLTTTGSSGPATFIGNVLNIPDYVFSSVNIYNTDGTLLSDRVVNLSSHNLTILSANAANQYDILFDDGTRQSQFAISLGNISNYIKNAGGDYLALGSGPTSSNTTISNVSTTIFCEVIQTQNGVTWRAVNGATTRRMELNTLGVRINNAFYLPSTDGTNGQVLRTNGLGITSWITPASGTVTSVGLSTGTTGTDVNVSGSPVTGSGSITLNIPTASATNRGALSSSDWSTFNGKQDALVSGTNIKTINGSSVIGSGNLSVGSVTSVGLTTGTTGTDVNVSGTPVTSSGSFTLNIPTASATNRGALSSSDWTTFNNKAATASPAFTGTPTTPTAATGTNTTQIASTAFVQDAINKQPEVIQFAVTDETTAITVGTSKITLRMPYAMNLTAVRASLSTAQTSGTIFTADIKLGGVSILGTKITIDNTEKTTTTAATPATIATSALTDDGEITVDVTQIGDGTAKGLKITLIGTRA